MLADDGKTVFPELLGANVNAKGRRQICRAGFACGGEKFFVVIHEFVAALLIDGV